MDAAAHNSRNSRRSPRSHHAVLAVVVIIVLAALVIQGVAYLKAVEALSVAVLAGNDGGVVRIVHQNRISNPVFLSGPMKGHQLLAVAAMTCDAKTMRRLLSGLAAPAMSTQAVSILRAAGARR
jgi:hypothetical protein